MIELVREMFSYTFMVRAAIVGVLVSLCAALLGVSLVLKRFSLIGDGLSHVGFGALSAAVALSLSPLYISIPVVMLAAVLLLRMGESGLVRGDAAIGVISSSSLAFGVIITTLGPGLNTDIFGYLFGSILAMDSADVAISIVLSAAVLVLYVLFYNRLFAVTFDESFARTCKARVGGYNLLLSLLTAATIVVGMRMMGSMLISGLIVFPALSAMRLFASYRSVILCAAALSVFSFLTGMLLAFAFSLPVGASVVMVSLAAFLAMCLAGRVKKTLNSSAI